MGFESKRLMFILLIVAGLTSCKQVELYERLKNVPGGNWKAGEKLSFPLTIKDTTIGYNLFVSIRHSNVYPYRNIWVRMGLQMPGQDSVSYQDFELPLADNEKWLGSGLNDIYDRRVRLFGQPQRFSKTGTVNFTLQHIMRDDPLPGVLQAGIRIEPVR
jgi:gliding motility-associated lipoprotein GldH